jgi:hypothetical protein
MGVGHFAGFGMLLVGLIVFIAIHSRMRRPQACADQTGQRSVPKPT